MSGVFREALPDVWEWSEGSVGCPGVVGRLSRMSGSGREALPNVLEWSGVPSWMSGGCREALPHVREWSGGSPGCLGVVGRPSRVVGKP